MSEQFPEYTEAIGSCKECGNSPVNHTLAKISNDLDMAVAYFSKRSGPTSIGNHILSAIQKFLDAVIHVGFTSAQWFGLVRYAHDPSGAKSYRSRVIWDEAIRRDIEMEQVVLLLGGKTDIYRAKINGSWVFFESLPIPAKHANTPVAWIDDKIALKEKLRAHGVPVPRAVSARTFEEAKKFLLELKAPLVVKPRIGTRGRHTTVYVRTEEDLARALQSAKKLCSAASVEEYFAGSVCRGTVVDGELVGFFQADPLVITGDGISSVEELIAQANEIREERVAPAEMTQEAQNFLRRLGFELTSIPAVGVEIPVGHRTGRLFGGTTRELLETVHPKMRKYLEEAANVLRISVVGFDVIIRDPETDPDTERWGIIEANTLPFIDLHYLPLYGKPSNPAAAVWNLWK